MLADVAARAEWHLIRINQLNRRNLILWQISRSINPRLKFSRLRKNPHLITKPAADALAAGGAATAMLAQAAARAASIDSSQPARPGAAAAAAAA